MSRSRSSSKHHRLDVDHLIDRLLDAGVTGATPLNQTVTVKELDQLCVKAQKVLAEQPSFIEIEGPVKVEARLR